MTDPRDLDPVETVDMSAEAFAAFEAEVNRPGRVDARLLAVLLRGAPWESDEPSSQAADR